MKKNIFFIVGVFLFSFVLSGCAVKNVKESHEFSEAVSTVSEEFNHYIDKAHRGNTLLFTSMVDVNNLSQSSNFGRLYSDALLTNLQRSGWNIIDYRGVKLLAEKKEGELYLSRESLKRFPKRYDYVVGTYGLYGKKLLINVRILDGNTNHVIVASNTLINNPEIIKMVLKDHCHSLKCPKPFSIELKKDDCKNTARCGEKH